MRLPGTTRLSPGLAREIALRDGIKAFVAGEIAAAGTQYVLSVSLVAANTGEVLVAHRETARDSAAISLPSTGYRRPCGCVLGESLTTIGRDPPLSRATTSSSRRFASFPSWARHPPGDATKALGLYEDALAVDSNFAAACWAIASLLLNAYPTRVERIAWAIARAFDLRDRLPARERHLATTAYYHRVLFDMDKAIAAHRAMLDLYPEDADVLTALGVVYVQTHQYAQAESVLYAGRWRAYFSSLLVLPQPGRRGVDQREIRRGIRHVRAHDQGIPGKRRSGVVARLVCEYGGKV